MIHGIYMCIPQPLSIADDNKSMGGVDLFDQHIAAYRTLRRCKKYWKSLFLDMLDIAATNSYRIFELYRADHPGAIERRLHHRHTCFRANLIRQLANLDIGAPPPKRRYSAPPQAPTAAEVALMHVPKHSPDLKRNCVNCYELEKAERRCVTYCAACDRFLHVSARDCFSQYHQRHFAV